ncbi:MAG: HU family DNA-binding protein [Holophagales bacterium]|nr:HU family DNA-binding protein [Holophagales bacterium]
MNREKGPSKTAATHRLTAIRQPYTKARLFAAISEETGLSRREVAAVFDSLSRLIHRHLKKRGAGELTLPGLCKFRVSTRKATKSRTMTHPTTGEEIRIPAKPARRIVRIRALKAVKDMAETP